MSYWLNRITQAKIEERLAKLDFAKVIVYVIGCVTHARDVVAAQGGDKLSDAFYEVGKHLSEFWNRFPESLEPEFAHACDEQVAKLFRQDDAEFPAGDDVLVWAASYGFSLSKMNRYGEKARIRAINAIGEAYNFVYVFHHEQSGIHASEEEMEVVQMRSSACNSEIEFQLGFLAAIETIQDQLPPYATILQRMSPTR